MALTLEIVTPGKRVYSDTIETVVLPTVEGEVGILPGHLPLLTQLEAGELRVMKRGRPEVLAVGGGFVEVAGDKVSVLAESAIDVEEIDETAVEKAMERAENALSEKAELDPTEVERLESVVRFAAAQLLIKKRRK